jgi:hypothetical protein
MDNRFLEKINKTDTCWLFTLINKTTGYGQYTVDGSTELAHRYSYKIHKGIIPDNLVVRHTCDIRNCVNPEHLLIGTTQDNINDKVERNRQSKGDTHYARTNPEKVARGERHGSKTHPEALVRGEEWFKSHNNHIISQSGVNNYLSKLTEDDVIEIRILAGFYSQRELARIYNMSKTSVAGIINRRTYKNII